MPGHACEAVIKSRGVVCNRPAYYEHDGGWRCWLHAGTLRRRSTKKEMTERQDRVAELKQRIVETRQKRENGGNR